MNNCWYDTVIDMSDALHPDWKLPTVAPYNVHVSNPDFRKVFSEKWLSYMNDLGLCVYGVMVFYRPAWFTNYEAHIDYENQTQTSIFGLNWIIGGDESEMAWYEIPDYDQITKWTMANTPYRSWAVNTLTEIERHSISGNRLTLVRVDVPHAIFVKEQIRWCISVRIVTKHDTWNDVVSEFSNRNLLIDRYI